jgi:hypothetical protein
MSYARILEFYDINYWHWCISQLPIKAISTLANFIAKIQTVWQQQHATVSTWQLQYIDIYGTVVKH